MRNSRAKLNLFIAIVVVMLSFVVGLCIVEKANASFSGGLTALTKTEKTNRMVLKDGKATVPSHYPKRVKEVIKAANTISDTPYIWGGGHGSFVDRGYDCSGSVSYALHGGRLLASPLTSGSLAGYGKGGKGRYITIYANSNHVFMKVGKLWYDTSGANPSRWQKGSKSLSGYVVRHPKNL